MGSNKIKDRWKETQQAFRSILLKRGPQAVDQIAERLPAARSTVYRFLGGDVSRPTHAMKAAIERIVEEETNGRGN